ENAYGLSSIDTDDANDSKQHWDWSSRQSKILIGSFVSVTTAVAWVAYSELVQDVIATKAVNAPFSLTYFFMMFLSLMFPVLLCGIRVISVRPMNDVLRECVHLYRGSQDFSGLQFAWKTCMFCLLGAADCTALFAANHSFVYLLSWIVLFEKFVAMRIFAMIFSITGIVLFAYVDGFGSPAMFGVVLGIASSAGAAVYGVLYKKFLGEVSSAQALFFISVVGLFSLLCFCPFWLLVYFLGSETIAWSDAPWGTIVSSAALASVYWSVKECAANLTYTVFIGLGLVLAVPVCAVADIVWKHREFSGMKIAALVLITTGVLLILLPEDWHLFICRRVRTQRSEDIQENVPNSTTLRGRLSRTSYM
ncbi:unnamed protein product, partial [Candidula unifasciata]